MKIRLELCFLLFSFSFFFSCQKEDLSSLNVTSYNSTASVTPHFFNWETIDWMPTPPGQTRIPSPWTGQGSIASVHGLDVINDRKASDGWELLYNTFNPNVEGLLQNPYFILYNKYRGLMRIFIYTTTQFVAPSSYIQDGLSIVSTYETSLLNFLGTDLIDVDENNSAFSQVQPAPDDGSLPLAANKWYMLQYELAYDPDLGNIPYQNIQLNWIMNYHNIEKISMDGEIVGTLKSSAGTNSEILSKLGDVGKTAGTLVLAGIGKNFFTKQTIDEETGENKLGLPNKIFKAAAEGAGKAISNAQSGLPKVIVNFLGAVIGGSSGSSTASFNLNANVKLEGTAASSGSFPASPTSMWVPGTNISPSAVGFIPLYNKKLGVFNLISKPTITVQAKCIHYAPSGPSPFNYAIVYAFPSIDYSDFLVYNPEVSAIADIKLVDQEVIVFKGQIRASETLSSNCTKEVIGSYGEVFTNPERTSVVNTNWEQAPTPDGDQIIGVRFTIQIKPKNGAPSSLISKTFLINVKYEVEETYDFMPS